MTNCSRCGLDVETGQCTCAEEFGPGRNEVLEDIQEHTDDAGGDAEDG